MDLEGLDRRVLVGRDEDDGGRVGEAGEHARELHAVQAGHPHVEEERVEALGAHAQERVARGVDAVHAVHALARAQHAREVLERGPLVVHGEDPHAARTPGANFGTVITTVVPSPGADCTTSP